MRIQRRGHGRPAPLDRLCRLCGDDLGHMYSQAPRRGIGPGLVQRGVDAALEQTIADAAQECGGEFIERLGRQFFSTQFDQQRSGGIHAACSVCAERKPGKPSFSRCAT